GFAARIHDIGKIAINDFIVTKPGRSTAAEYGMVQQHTTLGSDLIKNLALDPVIHLAILHHHENFDGTGYPHKIKGGQIPFEARVLRISDTYDALITDRVYRPAFTHEEARRLMYEEEQKFDSDFLKVFFKMNPARI
ncbi:MAG: HD domain-containing protein, partial [Chloroflexi bacterium]|nr:HD domain-containing protein [Chloroflexota bacterium]